jgi:2-polyprenyl-3-methyl-5-hydroxy-6-metoxy-1,4-benzoquinol methylase
LFTAPFIHEIQLMVVTATPENSTVDLEKLRQHFNRAPYPRVPVEHVPTDPNSLYIHSIETAYYRRYGRVVNPAGMLILDAGCGTGYKSLELAIANPGARVVGIDLSEDSVELARQRLAFHGVDNVEFHAMPLEDLQSLGMKFDYINADEVLYLIPDPIVGLKAMRSVLKPEGILRTNFHSALQRAAYLRSQSFFRQLGLMADAPTESDVEMVRAMMRSLKDGVRIKKEAWKPAFEVESERVLANHLLKGDKGWDLPEFFDSLRITDLEFSGMVNWWQWDLTALFEDINELPIEIAMGLAEKSLEEQLALFELLHPVYRLLDLYCGVPMKTDRPVVAEWTDEQWQGAMIYFPTQLKTETVREDLIKHISMIKTFYLKNYLGLTDDPVAIDSILGACLLPLIDGPQTMSALVDRWMMLYPVNPVTLNPTQAETVFEILQELLVRLEGWGYLMVSAS